MKPLLLMVSLIVTIVAGCSTDTVMGPESQNEPLTPAMKCSVVNGQLC